MSGHAADRVVAMLEAVAGAPSPVQVRAWDGSQAGPRSAPLLIMNNRRAIRRLVRRPGELGIARAFVAGDLDLGGDLVETLTRLAEAGRRIGRRPQLTVGRRWTLLRQALLLGALGPMPPVPAEEVVLSGRKHSPARDRAAISHHYDVGNEFYRLLLGPTLVYSCAYWRRPDDPGYGLDDAQRDKLDLVCRKLGLRPGMRLLDVGGGWGSLALHAARTYDARVVMITLSGAQVETARRRVAEAGLQGRVEVRLQDWRDVDEAPFDAIASVGMAEHVGQEVFADYAAQLYRQLRPGGRLLNHQIARGPGPTPTERTFIDAYVFPDGDLLPLATVVDALERAGFEVRDVQGLREHYTRTLRSWVGNLEAGWDDCVRLTSIGRARVWHLYLALSVLGFESGLLRIHQTLAVRPYDDGRSGIDPVRENWLSG
ncbi:cyclopropane-fatty-acyl-phospholipid synthase family protein [Microlunatus panaciterrae]|uniref:Cyclopropane-fatty-acyl-phospholipid synthase n=1 Tax=Microlunatus panaciterrae TaxID=400768 RepID=A0ABS2RK90_9ACTN|nr:class I SAM-dependent methyltransferase [Microlunatus panaciterrae]MBM7799419.1 cyclopropane-fatty-acyl-phospholipid synthase [Microlunatus panaciterrae]